MSAQAGAEAWLRPASDRETPGSLGHCAGFQSDQIIASPIEPAEGMAASSAPRRLPRGTALGQHGDPPPRHGRRAQETLQAQSWTLWIASPEQVDLKPTDRPHGATFGYVEVLENVTDPMSIEGELPSSAYTLWQVPLG